MAHEFDGKKYEKASSHQKEWGNKLIAELSLNGLERVLDLGCGDGSLTSEIAERVPGGYVLGVDDSQGMINTALPKARQNLQFRKLDINDLDFDNEFDLVFSNAALHWVKDHHRLFEKVKKALREDGCLRFQFAGEGNCTNFFAVVREAMEQEEFKEFFHGFEWPWYMPSVDDYTWLVEASGLRHIRVWGENADRFFPDAEALTRWIDQPSLVPFLARVTEPVKGLFRNYVVNNMIKRTQQTDGRYFETFRRVNVSAMK